MEIPVPPPLPAMPKVAELLAKPGLSAPELPGLPKVPSLPEVAPPEIPGAPTPANNPKTLAQPDFARDALAKDANERKAMFEDVRKKSQDLQEVHAQERDSMFPEDSPKVEELPAAPQPAAPKLEVPQVEAPKPEIPKLEAPKLELPKLEMPKPP